MSKTTPEGWRRVKLGDYLTVLTDYHANGSYKKLKENVELLDTPNYALMIRTTNFEQNNFDKDLKYITKSAYDFLQKSQVRPGDILMNKIANAGSVYYMPDLNRPVSLAMNLFLLRTKEDEVNQKFVFYYLKANESYIKQFAIGTAATTITKDAVRNIEILLPPLNAQNKISSILSNYDRLIENNTRRIQILEEMARSLYNEWFVKFRFPGHEQTKLVDSELGLIPKSWKVEKLGDVIELAYGKSLTAKNRIPGSVPVYGSAGVVGYHNESLTSGPGIIVGRKGNVGSVFWSDNDFFPIDTVFYVQTKVSLPYIYYNLQAQNFINNDAAVPGLNRNQAYSLPFLLPEKDLLEKFQRFVAPVFKCLKNLKIKNENLKQTRDLLLPMLISGEIDVESLDIESKGKAIAVEEVSEVREAIAV
jgi:type I restriction enzyme, S subunit